MLGVAHRLIHSLLSANMADAGYDLTATEVIVLVHLLDNDGMTQVEIGEMLTCDKTATTRLVDSLECQGLARRVHDREDRRRNKVFMTEAGLTAIRNAKPVAQKTLQQALKGIDKVDVETCKRVLQRVIENVGGESSGSGRSRRTRHRNRE